MIVVDVTIFIHTANRSMKMWNTAFGFRMQPNRVFAVSQMSRTRADFSILANNQLFVKLRNEILPELLPVFDVKESGVFSGWT
ncbi:hypothetical protein JCM17136A_17880 [Phocaeicola sartorii JCM 17136 = DSM 21941]